ncbi:hypothetical protein BDF14DRAFT_1799695 [Spinellus fusiger]|nr:hypothetical protein BDF14DRAFT_1799695 [Spinellus fusiger]
MPKTILITGGTTGLGLAAAKKLLEDGHNVVITGRNTSKLEAAKTNILQLLGTSAIERLYTIVLDLEQLQSVRDAVNEFKALKLPLNVLINNAGMIFPELEYIEDSRRVEKTVFVNSIAPLYLTYLLVPLFDQATEGRILFITSLLHDPRNPGRKKDQASSIPESIDLNDLDGHGCWDSMLFYKISKLCNVWITYILSQHLKHPLTVNAICPGFVPTTGLSRNSSFLLRMIMRYVISQMSFATTEQESAEDYLYYATSPDLNNMTGAYFKKRKAIESSVDSMDLAKGTQFWNLACDMCNIDRAF